MHIVASLSSGSTFAVPLFMPPLGVIL